MWHCGMLMLMHWGMMMLISLLKLFQKLVLKLVQTRLRVWGGSAERMEARRLGCCILCPHILT
jgi:hypothetical protein